MFSFGSIINIVNHQNLTLKYGIWKFEKFLNQKLRKKSHEKWWWNYNGIVMVIVLEWKWYWNENSNWNGMKMENRIIKKNWDWHGVAFGNRNYELEDHNFKVRSKMEIAFEMKIEAEEE